MAQGDRQALVVLVVVWGPLCSPYDMDSSQTLVITSNTGSKCRRMWSACSEKPADWSRVGGHSQAVCRSEFLAQPGAILMEPAEQVQVWWIWKITVGAACHLPLPSRPSRTFTD
jgi:hypothetical protein